MAFRYKRSIAVSYARQIYIYAVSLNYAALREEQRACIDALCRVCGGEYAEALREFVTTEQTATGICMRHHIASRTTLHRAVRRYYENFPERL